MNLPNVQKVACGMYVVRTQAGFKQAVKDYLGDDFTMQSFNSVEGIPTRYPCVVSLCDSYRGYHFIKVNTVHLNVLHDVCQADKEASKSP